MRVGKTTARSVFFRHWRAVGRVICKRQEDMQVCDAKDSQIAVWSALRCGGK